MYTSLPTSEPVRSLRHHRSGSTTSTNSANGNGSFTSNEGSNFPWTFQFKLLMIGDSGVGKSSLIHRYTNDFFTPNFMPTIGIDFKVKQLAVEDKFGKRTFRLSIFDTAGQERFRTITKQYFRGAHGMILVYDCTNRTSFENVYHWLSQINDGGDAGVIIVLAANKCDHPAQVVTEEEGQALADECGIRFFKTSAKTDTNVSEMFLALTLDIERQMVLRRSIEERNENYDETIRLTKLPSKDLDYNKGGYSSCCGGSATVPN